MLVDSLPRQAIGYFQTGLVLSSEHTSDQRRISTTFLKVKEHHSVFPRDNSVSWVGRTHFTRVAFIFHGIHFTFIQVEQGP